LIIINNEICNEGKILIDDGFSFGRGLFETILVKNDGIFLREHLERLNAGLKKLGINQYITEDYVKNNIEKLKCENCGVKIIVSDKNIVFIKREINYTEELYQKGFSLAVSNVRRNKSSILTYLKSINYMDNILEREKALKEGYDEIIFLNDEEMICEGSISNIFFIRNNAIYTPSIKCGILDGIVRQWLINRYNVTEGQYSLKDLSSSDGIFITNSLMGVMGISKLCGNTVKKTDIIDNIRVEYNEYLEGKNRVLY